MRFQGLVANSDVSMSVEAGSITALIGPNGAGKTTLFNVVSGVIKPDAGRLKVGGHDITGTSTIERAELGLARTFQSLLLAPSLTALDNVMLGAARFGRFGRLANVAKRGMLSPRQLRGVAEHALEFVGIAHRAGDRVDALPFGDRRRVELARALAGAPRLLLLDEPASGLPRSETTELIDVIRRARTELGTTVLLVEHDMSFVRGIAETTVVLDFGVVLATGPTAEVLADDRVVAAYLGTGSSGGRSFIGAPATDEHDGPDAAADNGRRRPRRNRPLTPTGGGPKGRNA